MKIRRILPFLSALALLCSLGWSPLLYGQKEAAIWYFGNNAGLDFRTGTPIPLTNGQLNTIEGCESFSDPDGNLLFYTDGKTVWNRQHRPMPNGTELRSSFSTSQAALVVPQPGAPGRYYVFTPDDVLAYRISSDGAGTNGFNYSIIEMDREGGLGDVVLKNQDLLEHASENVTAVRDYRRDLYWILTHYQDRFYAYRLDASGLDPNPVVTRIGPDIDNPENFRGNIKISPDGTRVAIAHNILEPRYQGALYLYDFDLDTGVLSGARAMPADRLYYGVEFSPNSRRLYASSIELVPGEEPNLPALDFPQLVQFNLDAPNVAGSLYVVYSYPNRLPGWVSGALQLGIDKKIYHTLPGPTLSVIRSPDKVGIDCDFRPGAISLGGAVASYGLPPYIQSFFETIVEIQQFCLGQPTEFRIPDPLGIQSVQWDFDDPSTGAANQSATLNPTHTFSTYGVFEVRLEVTYTSGASRSFVEFVEIAEQPSLAGDVTLVQCDIDGVDDGLTRFNLREAIPLIGRGNPDINAYFFNSQADAQANVNHLDPWAYPNTIPGEVVWARAYENPECYQVLPVRLQTTFVPDYLEPIQAPVCLERAPTLATEFDTAPLYAFVEGLFPGGEIVGLYTSETRAHMDSEALVPGPFVLGPLDAPRMWFRVEQGGGCTSVGILDLDFRLPPADALAVEVPLCNGQALLEAAPGYEAYLWENGAQDSQVSVRESGIYTVQLLDGSCSWTQVFTVTEPANFALEEVEVLDFRERNQVRIQVAAGEAPLQFSLDGGQTFQEEPVFNEVAPGVYDLMVTDGCQVEARSLIVGGLPAFFTPNGDGYNDRWHLFDPGAFPGYKLSVFDRYGNLVALMEGSHPGWDGTRSGASLPVSDYWYRLELLGGRVVQGHVALIR